MTPKWTKMKILRNRQTMSTNYFKEFENTYKPTGIPEDILIWCLEHFCAPTKKKECFFHHMYFCYWFSTKFSKSQNFKKTSQNFFSKKFSKVFATESEPRIERRPDFFWTTHQHIGKLWGENDTNRRCTHACMCAQKFWRKKSWILHLRSISNFTSLIYIYIYIYFMAFFSPSVKIWVPKYGQKTEQNC